MKRCTFLFVSLVTLIPALTAEAQPEKARVFILTDISNEPDDEESMVRFLVYANQYNIEGLVATTSTWLRKGTREDLIRRQLNAYGQVRDKLMLHESGFPTQQQLEAVTTTGQPTYGMESVGAGKTTAGSKLLLAAADRADDRPLWVCAWGGANTLAQALFDARQQRNAQAVSQLVKKLRVYAISDQDDAGAWLRREFPELTYVVSPSTADWKEYWRATWTGISGDRHYKNGPMHHFELVDNPWLLTNVIINHGPLGQLYPKLEYIMEGDTPSFLGLINNGLGWAVSPAHGGWGGRYVWYQAHGETHPIWTNNQESRDRVTANNGQTECTDMATIWRWRQQFQHDFATRMDWCITTYDQANHNPVAVLNGDVSKKIIELTVKSGTMINLSSKGSIDPDKQAISTKWWVYREAGTHTGEVKLTEIEGETTGFEAPKVTKPATIHVILQVEDQGTPSLTAYRRAIVTIEPN